MNSLIEEKVLNWSIRHGLSDAIKHGTISVSDKVGMTNWIDSMSEEQLLETFDMINVLEIEHEQKKFLEESFRDAQIEKNPELITLTESVYANAVGHILTEADETSDPRKEPISKILKHGTVAAGASYLLWVAMNKGPDEFNRQLQGLKIISKEKYQQVRNALYRMRKSKGENGILPDLTKSIEKNRELHKHLSQKGNIDAETTAGLTGEMRSATSASLGNMKKNILGFLNKSKRYAVIALGLTATSALLFAVYQRFASKAAKACRGEAGSKARKVCVLRFKIKACDEAVRAGHEALGGCSKHKNPERCTHSIQSDIWNWQRRKKKYEAKLALVAGSRELTPSNDAGSKPDIFRHRA